MHANLSENMEKRTLFVVLVCVLLGFSSCNYYPKEVIYESNFKTLDLRVYADALDGEVYHYRDKTGLECDTVLHLRNGQYGLIEIKLGGDELINDGASALKTLADKIDTTKMKKPSFLMVLTAVGDFAYQRKEDGVFVVPIGCLRN